MTTAADARGLTEFDVAPEQLLSRLQTIELNGEPERLRSTWANAHTSLPIKFTPST